VLGATHYSPKGAFSKNLNPLAGYICLHLCSTQKFVADSDLAVGVVTQTSQNAVSKPLKSVLCYSFVSSWMMSD
jgi:hypothetical protein